MRRPILLLVLATAAVGTGLLAVEMLDRGSSDGRRDREQAGFEPPAPERVRIETAEPEAPPTGPRGGTFPVSGIVMDTAERPIPGATVRATPFGAARALETRTDEKGRYAIVLPGPVCSFDVFATGYLPAIGTVNGRPNGRESFACEGEGPWHRDFLLEVAASLTGRVMADGRAVRGATVYVIDPQHQLLDQVHAGNVVRTDADGAYRFPGLAAGTVDVAVDAGVLLPALHRDVEVPERGEVRRDFHLVAGRTVAVTVKNATGQSTVLAADARLRGKLLPPGGVEALALALVGREFIDFPVRRASVEDGRAVLRGLGPEPADVEARDPARITEPGLSGVLASLEPRLALTLVPARKVPLVVLDAASRAPLDPTIRRETAGAEDNLPVEWAAGVASLPFDDRRHTLHFELDGYDDAKLELPPATVAWPETFEVVMTPAADAETGAFYVVFEPKLTGRIALVGRDADGRQRWVKHVDASDEQDRWEVKKVPLGEHRVAVLASGSGRRPSPPSRPTPPATRSTSSSTATTTRSSSCRRRPSRGPRRSRS